MCERPIKILWGHFLSFVLFFYLGMGDPSSILDSSLFKRVPHNHSCLWSVRLLVDWIFISSWFILWIIWSSLIFVVWILIYFSIHLECHYWTLGNKSVTCRSCFIISKTLSECHIQDESQTKLNWMVYAVTQFKLHRTLLKKGYQQQVKEWEKYKE